MHHPFRSGAVFFLLGLSGLLMSGKLGAQSRTSSTVIEPARGYYSEFQRLDTTGVDASVDALTFHPSKEALSAISLLKPTYLKGVNADVFRLANPPANSSSQTRAELDFLLRLQRQRTRHDIETSISLASIVFPSDIDPDDISQHAYRQNLFHIGSALGTWYCADNLPRTARLLSGALKDANYFVWQLKLRYARIRPYTLEPQIENLEDANWAAYPSGHAANGYVCAFILMELAPEWQDLFLTDALDMARSREILGVHFPSDSEAARVFARQLVNQLLQDNQFVTDLAGVRTEWINKASELAAFVNAGLLKPASKNQQRPLKK